MEIIGTIISAQDEPNKSGEGESFKVRFREIDGRDWGPFTLFHDGLKEKATELKGKVNSANLTVEKPEGKRFWDLTSIASITPEDSPEPIYSSSRDDAIATQVAVKTVAELWIAGKLSDTDGLVKGLRAELSKHLKVESPDKPAPKTAPPYKDKEGDDVSKATNPQKEALKKMLGITDGDNFTNCIRGRFGDEALEIKDLSKNEAGDWITELQKENK